MTKDEIKNKIKILQDQIGPLNQELNKIIKEEALSKQNQKLVELAKNNSKVYLYYRLPGNCSILIGKLNITSNNIIRFDGVVIEYEDFWDNDSEIRRFEFNNIRIQNYLDIDSTWITISSKNDEIFESFLDEWRKWKIIIEN